MYELAWLFLFSAVILAVLAIFSMLAMFRKPPKKKPRYIEAFEASAPPEIILTAIVSFSLEQNMNIEYFNEYEGKIILGDKLSIWTFGFFYPIYLTSKETGKTLVEVGVRGKASITGTVAFRYRDKVVNGIKGVVFMKLNAKKGVTT